MSMVLDELAWTLGDAPDEWPRSRYSGAALYPGKMIVTIIISQDEIFGHALIVFEWFADELPGPRIHQRRHEVYQLIPETSAKERTRGKTQPAPAKLVSHRARAAQVDMDPSPEFFPLRDEQGRKRPAGFRSWLVPFEDGWRARMAAIDAMQSPPTYNYFELNGGKNCARWVMEIAALAGINTRHALSSIVAVPKLMIPRATAVDEEDMMWRRRLRD